MCGISRVLYIQESPDCRNRMFDRPPKDKNSCPPEMLVRFASRTGDSIICAAPSVHVELWS